MILCRPVQLKFFFMLLATLVLLQGCEPQQNESTTAGGIVEVNPAYQKYFGSVPAVKEGRAYAHVAYLPLKDNPQKLGPQPIFLFAAENRYKHVLQKLISGDLVEVQKTIFYHPFPDSLDLTIHPLKKDILPLELQTDSHWDLADQKMSLNALTETALQFEEVKGVTIKINGTTPPTMPEEGCRHDEEHIVDPLPPILILMAGTWESGGQNPEEILLEFDRPVEIKELNLFHADGRKVEGDYFTSIFQMAAVIHPEHPEKFREATLLKAEWAVIDNLGRQNSGTDTMPFKKLAH